MASVFMLATLHHWLAQHSQKLYLLQLTLRVIQKWDSHSDWLRRLMQTSAVLLWKRIMTSCSAKIFGLGEEISHIWQNQSNCGDGDWLEPGAGSPRWVKTSPARCLFHPCFCPTQHLFQQEMFSVGQCNWRAKYASSCRLMEFRMKNNNLKN